MGHKKRLFNHFVIQKILNRVLSSPVTYPMILSQPTFRLVMFSMEFLTMIGLQTPLNAMSIWLVNAQSSHHEHLNWNLLRNFQPVRC
ncbi:hypothetical protein C484_11221 [Natrialba taiwanensis DSM 12281]|uniref:Uncharacterized protein n=1 Tax=Natrialba taiwanensis DSM 12281 TaxID=1230458 RepID=L9ZWC3_9EURY|nr:hypothetical protein C484_11221 [Natrialba taiwanensis DSM 12281]